MADHTMTPETTRAGLGRKNLLNAADNLICAVQGAYQDMVVAAAQPALWSAGFQLMEDNDDDVRRLGYALVFTAIIATPGVLEETVRTLREQLSTSLPVTWKEYPTRHEPIERTIGGTKVEMEPDGTLWIDSGERDFRTDIWQTELLALHAFLNTPDVAARLDALRQTDTTATD